MLYDVLPINEFVLWDNCLNNCQFCFLKIQGKPFLEDIQLKSILNLKLILDDGRILNCHILIVGGEIFNIKNILKTKFLELIDTIISLQHKNILLYLYVNTSLTYEDTNCLDEFILKYIDNNLINKLKFTTSYDLFGRFTDKSKYIFENTLCKLTHISGLNIVVNSILTKQFCNYIKNEFLKKTSYVKYFEETFKCKLNLIPYVNVNDKMLPETSDVLNVLLNERRFYNSWFTSFKDNYNLIQLKNVYKFNENVFINNTAKNAKCGHSINFCKYSTSNSCFICDINKVFES